MWLELYRKAMTWIRFQQNQEAFEMSLNLRGRRPCSTSLLLRPSFEQPFVCPTGPACPPAICSLQQRREVHFALLLYRSVSTYQSAHAQTICRKVSEGVGSRRQGTRKTQKRVKTFFVRYRTAMTCLLDPAKPDESSSSASKASCRKSQI